MDYEREQERLLRLMEEVPSSEEFDDEEESGEEDIVEKIYEGSETEEECSEDEDRETNDHCPYFMGKDGHTKWYKHMPPKNVRTRQENLVLALPGTKPCVKDKTSAGEIWDFLFDSEMLTMIVEWTNKKIENEIENFIRGRELVLQIFSK